MKAIEYRGQNDFYLFDKLEEESGDETFKRVNGNNLLYLKERDKYKTLLQANLSAGKKIINPEVILTNDYTGSRWFLVTGDSISGPDYQELKPGDIFPLSDNIGFEEKLQLIQSP